MLHSLYVFVAFVIYSLCGGDARMLMSPCSCPSSTAFWVWHSTLSPWTLSPLSGAPPRSPLYSLSHLFLVVAFLVLFALCFVFVLQVQHHGSEVGGPARLLLLAEQAAPGTLCAALSAVMTS